MYWNTDQTNQRNYLKLMLGLCIVSFLFLLSGCLNTNKEAVPTAHQKVKVVATTTMLADLAKTLGGDYVEVTGLMGPGIDPHLYQASAGDVSTIQAADLVVYNGLDLESKLADIFANLNEQGSEVVMIAKGLPTNRLLADEETGGIDPHIWFDVELWQQAAHNLYAGLSAVDPNHASEYKQNYEMYGQKLQILHDYVNEQIATIPEQARVLITAHDAFQYFGQAYGFEVIGLQGISTEAEAGTADVSGLARIIVERQIKAIFVESSVPPRQIQALQEAVQAQGFEVVIGGELHSDSLGSVGTAAETYIGTIQSNIDTIVEALR